MKTLHTFLYLIFSSFLLNVCPANAQSTAFTYQGSLNAGQSAANGSYDFTFALFDAASDGTQKSGTWTQLATPVSNGLFTVTLDFGNQFPGANRWLEIGVRTNGGSTFVTLNPRQPITATPYAMRANSTDLAATVVGIQVNTNLSSAAFGFNTTASGSASTAFGQGSQASGLASTAMGNNTVAIGLAATAMGRSTLANGASSFASGRDTVAGGDYSTALGRNTTANGLDSTALGNQTMASGSQSTALGQSTTAGGIASFAAGTQSRANHDGSFVWADYNFADFTSTANNQFLIRAAGGVGINTNNPNGAALAVNGNVNVNGTISGNATGLTNMPDNSLVRTTTNVSIVAWGDNSYGQATVPAGLSNVVAAAAGAGHSVAVKTDGTVVAWGDNSFAGQTNVPAGLSNVTAVSAGDSHSLALKTDGTVVAWGFNSSGQTNVPAGLNNVAAVSAGELHSLALRTDGTVVAWGENGGGQLTVPAGLSNVAAIEAGAAHNLALKTDGTVVAWGYNGLGQTNVPVGLNNVVAVAAGFTHSLALKSDGTVVGWGMTSVPAGLSNVTAVSAGYSHSLALKRDGTVVGWGNYSDLIPVGLGNVIAIARGSSSRHVLAIQKQPSSPMAWLDVDNTFNGNIHVNGTLSGNGSGLTGLTSSQIPSLDASKITSGKLADAQLSANVALRSGGNAFTGTQTITGGSVGIGIAPQSTLHVNGTARIQGADNWDVNNTEGDFRVGNNTQRFKIGVSTGGGGAGDVWMRAQGGTARLFIKTPGGTFFYSNEGQTAGVSLAANGTSWAVISDRNLKKDFAAVDNVQVLEKLAALPITQWRYNWESEETTPHIGPMAQDFKAAFYPGTDDKSITTQEADGVALAAIQGLNQKLEDELKHRNAENAELKQRLEKLEQLLNVNTRDSAENR